MKTYKKYLHSMYLLRRLHADQLDSSILNFKPSSVIYFHTTTKV